MKDIIDKVQTRIENIYPYGEDATYNELKTIVYFECADLINKFIISELDSLLESEVYNYINSIYKADIDKLFSAVTYMNNKYKLDKTKQEEYRLKKDILNKKIKDKFAETTLLPREVR